MQDYCVDKCNNVCKRSKLSSLHIINNSYYCKKYLYEERQIPVIELCLEEAHSDFIDHEGLSLLYQPVMSDPPP